MNYLDLFSGIGGFALGIQQTGVKINKHYFSEIDKNAISIYQKHFKNAENLGDVKTIRDFSKLRNIDLITFGFPCQDLSVAGKGAGFNGTRSSLFYEATRIIREIKPTYFIFENVKGLFSNDKGRSFEKVLQEIANIGLYECEWQLLNTSWVLPQNRERVYFIGHLRGKSKPKVFPFRESDFAPTIIPGQTINCITTRSGENTTVGSYVIESEFYEKTKASKSSTGKTGFYTIPRGNNRGGYRVTDKCPTITTGCFEQNNFIMPVLTPSRIKKSQNGRRFKENGDPSFTITTQDQHGIYDGFSIRRLTPLECERLQGFPDGWTDGLSDSARYKVLGNAVSVPIVKMIMERLLAAGKIQAINLADNKMQAK